MRRTASSLVAQEYFSGVLFTRWWRQGSGLLTSGTASSGDGVHQRRRPPGGGRGARRAPCCPRRRWRARDSARERDASTRPSPRPPHPAHDEQAQLSLTTANCRSKKRESQTLKRVPKWHDNNSRQATFVKMMRFQCWAVDSTRRRNDHAIPNHNGQKLCGVTTQSEKNKSLVKTANTLLARL